MKHLDDISDKDIVSLNIPTRMPLAYEFDEKLKPVKHYYLGDSEEVKKRMEFVVNQGKVR